MIKLSAVCTECRSKSVSCIQDFIGITIFKSVPENQQCVYNEKVRCFFYSRNGRIRNVFVFSIQFLVCIVNRIITFIIGNFLINIIILYFKCKHSLFVKICSYIIGSINFWFLDSVFYTVLYGIKYLAADTRAKFGSIIRYKRIANTVFICYTYNNKNVFIVVKSRFFTKRQNAR